MSHISSAYRLHTTCVYVHVRKGARGSWKTRLRFSSAKLLYLLLASARNASYCELLRVSNHKFTHVNIYLRWFAKISFSATQKIV